MVNIAVINLNASRFRNRGRIEQIYSFLKEYDPYIVCIQEINVATALQVLDGRFQIFINIEKGSKDGIGIVTLVKLGIQIRDVIIGQNGRIIGLLLDNIQIWNVYPKSGSAFRKEREIFFREELTELFVQWKDNTKYIFQIGDHNCTHRMEDSLYNGAQHLQKALISHLQVQGLSDDFLNVHGNNAIMFSRRTENSETRIDYIFSNSKACIYFQYLSVTGLDHSAALAMYEIDVNVVKEQKPKNRFYRGWVISKCLENDEEFLEQAEFIINHIHDEAIGADKDPSFYWLKLKTALTNLAISREKRYKK